MGLFTSKHRNYRVNEFDHIQYMTQENLRRRSSNCGKHFVDVLNVIHKYCIVQNISVRRFLRLFNATRHLLVFIFHEMIRTNNARNELSIVCRSIQNETVYEMQTIISENLYPLEEWIVIFVIKNIGIILLITLTMSRVETIIRRF